MKKRKAQIAGVMLGGIIAVIIGVALIPVFTSLIDDAQTIKSVLLEQKTNTAFNTTFNLDKDDLVGGSIVVLNSTGGSSSSVVDTLRDNSEFILNEKTGVFKVVNRTGTWNLSYNYEPTTYLDTSTGRTIVKQITLMYAVALIVITLGSVGIVLAKK
jgi:hypothetical protein|tara:strand:+ start:268 stop:738 length:471 start_codon:yes stop_codon:yes gene_type:complete